MQVGGSGLVFFFSLLCVRPRRILADGFEWRRSQRYNELVDTSQIRTDLAAHRIGISPLHKQSASSSSALEFSIPSHPIPSLPFPSPLPSSAELCGHASVQHQVGADYDMACCPDHTQHSTKSLVCCSLTHSPDAIAQASTKQYHLEAGGGKRL